MADIDSSIDTHEVVENKDRKFGAQLEYYPCMIDGEPALFTYGDLVSAKERAARNPEDIPEDKSFWDSLWG